MEKRRLILVDDNQSNLTACKKALKDAYDVYPCPSAEKMFEVLGHVIPDLILLDVEMPAVNGYEAMRILKKHDEYKDIPVIFLSAMDDAKSEMEGLTLGAIDYIHKPFIGELLARRIETHLSIIDSKKELLALNKSIVGLLANKESGGGPSPESREEAIRELIIKNGYLTKMANEIRAPLTAIIDKIEAAIDSDDIERIRSFLGDANTETRLILEIINDIADVQPER